MPYSGLIFPLFLVFISLFSCLKARGFFLVTNGARQLILVAELRRRHGARLQAQPLPAREQCGSEPAPLVPRLWGHAPSSSHLPGPVLPCLPANPHPCPKAGGGLPNPHPITAAPPSLCPSVATGIVGDIRTRNPFVALHFCPDLCHLCTRVGDWFVPNISAWDGELNSPPAAVSLLGTPFTVLSEVILRPSHGHRTGSPRPRAIKAGLSSRSPAAGSARPISD